MPRGAARTRREGPRRAPGSTHDALNNLGEIPSRVGQAVIVVLPLPAGGDESAVPEEGEVVTHGGLALTQLLRQRPDVVFLLG